MMHILTKLKQSLPEGLVAGHWTIHELLWCQTCDKCRREESTEAAETLHHDDILEYSHKLTTYTGSGNNDLSSVKTGGCFWN